MTDLPEADVLLAKGRTEEAARLFLEAYIADPNEWHHLRTYCELTRRPYREPNDRGPELAEGSLDPLQRLCLYTDLTGTVLSPVDDDDEAPDGDDEEDDEGDDDEGADEGEGELELRCDHSFVNTLAWAEESEVDAIELFQLLNDFGAFCDCQVPLVAWPRDTATERIVVAGWLRGSAGGVEIPLESRVEARELILPPQVTSGVDLLDALADTSESFGPSQLLVVAVHFPDVPEAPVVAVVDAEDLSVYSVRDRFASEVLTQADHTRVDKLIPTVRKHKLPKVEFTNLPSADTQQWLQLELATLIRARGAELFLRTPLLDPPVTATGSDDADRVRALMRALLDHAGLSEIPCHIRLRTYEDALADGSVLHPMAEGEWQSEGTLGWFEGFDDGRAVFGVDLSAHAELDALVGTLSHEIAHAFRRHHGLEVEDREAEEVLTDLTTHYLGFGVFTTASTSRYRTSGGIVGQWAYSEWQHSRAGYVPAREMCYLLAVQTVARGASAGDVRRIGKRLEPNQRGYFRAAVDELWDDETLGGNLGVGRGRRRRRGPDPRPGAGARGRAPLRADVDSRDSIEVWDHREGDEGEGYEDDPDEPAFAMASHQTRPLTLLLMFLAVPLGWGVAVLTGDEAIGIILAVVFGALVWWKGPGTKADCCTVCGVVVPEEADDCPGCQRPIVGWVADGYEWLDAKDRHRAGLPHDPDPS